MQMTVLLIVGVNTPNSTSPNFIQEASCFHLAMARAPLDRKMECEVSACMHPGQFSSSVRGDSCAVTLATQCSGEWFNA